MAFSIRLRVAPINGENWDGEPRVTGMKLAFTSFGPPPTKAERGASKDAKIEFKAQFLQELRQKHVDAERPLGELKGKVTLSTDTNHLRFDCDPMSLYDLTHPPEDADEPNPPPPFEPMLLKLDLSREDFKEVKTNGRRLQLKLPKDSGKWKHLEVVTKLTIAGAVEADFQVNDVLDVPIHLVTRNGYPFST